MITLTGLLLKDVASNLPTKHFARVKVGTKNIYALVLIFKSSCLDTPSGCEDCKIPKMDIIGRPEPTAFSFYLPFFLQDNPSDSCAKGGHAAYGQVRNKFYFIFYVI
jgi:hypothetical protein